MVSIAILQIPLRSRARSPQSFRAKISYSFDVENGYHISPPAEKLQKNSFPMMERVILVEHEASCRTIALMRCNQECLHSKRQELKPAYNSIRQRFVLRSTLSQDHGHVPYRVSYHVGAASPNHGHQG